MGGATATGHRDGALHVLAREIHPLGGLADDYDELLEQFGDASLVLLGEASHGTHEFYRDRAEITRRLIGRRVLRAVPSRPIGRTPRVHRYVTRGPRDPDAAEALAGFRRFPHWMWRNAEVLDFVGWLRAHNDAQRPAPMLLGSTASTSTVSTRRSRRCWRTSGRSILRAAPRAAERYACFDPSAADSRRTGSREPGDHATCRTWVRGAAARAATAARNTLPAATGLRPRTTCSLPNRTPAWSPTRSEYYRTMFSTHVSSWNLRDRHMADTLAQPDDPPPQESG